MEESRVAKATKVALLMGLQMFLFGTGKLAKVSRKEG